MNSFEEIFELMKKKLDLTDTAMNLWINPIKPIKLNNNKVILYVKDPYPRQIITENYIGLFEKNFQDILGFSVEVEIIGDENLTADQKTKIITAIPELQDDFQIYDKLEKAVMGSNYKHTFDTFIVGESNKLAYAACKAIAQGQTSNYNPLYIYSPPGLGKTHLLTAVSNEIKRNRPDSSIVFVAAETFVNEYVNSLKNVNLNNAFKAKYRTADILLIDDIQFISGKKESQNELFHTFNELHVKGKQIVFTSDRPPKEIMDIDQRLFNRFEWGLLADISIPEFETRLAIIKRKAELLGLEIPSNVMEYMADKLRNNIRQLEGAIVKMNALYIVTDVPLTIAMAQNVIKEILTEQQPVPVTVEKIISEVAEIYNISSDEIRSQKRSAQISTARQVAIYVVHKTTRLSCSAIGQEFGGRDHSTIVYAINKVKTTLEKDSSFKATVDDLIKNTANSQL